MLVHLDLFSGIGGFALACQWAGIETIGFVEIDKFCQKMLRKRFPNVPIVEDIRDVEKIKEIVAHSDKGRCEPQVREALSEGRKTITNPKPSSRSSGGATISRETIKEIVANATGERLSNRGRASLANAGTEKPESQRCNSSRSRIQSNAGAGILERESPTILVTAGFPCQPFSVAGKRQGERDNRYLWPQTLSVIKEIKPEWVLLENVTGIKSVYQPDMLSELEGREYTTEEEAKANLSGILERETTNTLWLVLEGLRGAGYEVEVLVIPACAVNAWHRRDRIWVVGYASNNGQLDSETRRRLDARNKRSKEGKKQVCQSEGTSSLWEKNVWNALGNGCEGGHSDARGTECGSEQGRMCQLEGTSDVTIPKGNGIQGRGSIINSPSSRDWRSVKPELGRMANGFSYFVDGYFDSEPPIPRIARGIKNRKERIRCLGNAIVPQVAYEIIKVIKELEDGLRL